MAWLQAGRTLACAALLSAACGEESSSGDHVPGRPSFVVILADDLGWADVGYQGSRFHRTPEIDALARDGLVFSRAYAAAPVCSPSRAALVSGLAPARLHLTDALGPRTPSEDAEERSGVSSDELVEPTVRDRLAEGTPTIASELCAAGYATAWIGKWHLGGSPADCGFERVIGASTAGAAPSYFSPYGLAALPDGPDGEYLTDRLTDEAVRFLEERHERPFLLVLAHFAPHLPLQAPAELVREYEARVDPAEPQRNPIYAAMVERLDASVGRVRATIERLGLADRTLLVFTSDNGGFEEKRLERARRSSTGEASAETAHITSNAPLRGGKGRLYEGGLRVPLVLWGGPVARSGTCETPVIGTDLAPTLLALAGCAPLATSDGVDLSPLLARPAAIPRVLAFHHPHQAMQSALVRDHDKLVYSWRTEGVELFDLHADPGEEHDLALERPERAAQLRAALFRWLDAVGADRPARRP